jgi:SP family general alpha glucoside:H+ symporter-like MFS transporter
MIGAWTAGPIADRFGRRAAFAVGGLIYMAGIAVVYTASSPGVFLAGKMVNGIALGMCIATGQAYVSEITPLALRGITLSAFTFSLVSMVPIRRCSGMKTR